MSDLFKTPNPFRYSTYEGLRDVTTAVLHVVLERSTADTCVDAEIKAVQALRDAISALARISARGARL